MKTAYKYYMLTKVLIKALLLSTILCLTIAFAIITSINIVIYGYQYTVSNTISPYLTKPSKYIVCSIEEGHNKGTLCVISEQASMIISNYVTSVRIVYVNYTLLSTFLNLKLNENTTYVGYVLARTLGLRRNTVFTLEIKGRTHRISNWNVMSATGTDLDISVILPIRNIDSEKYDYCLVKNNISSLGSIGVGNTSLFMRNLMLNILNVVLVWKYFLVLAAAIVSSMTMIRMSLSRVGTLIIFRSLGASLKDILVSYVTFSIIAISLAMAIGFSLGTIVSYVIVKILSLTLEIVPFIIRFNWVVLANDYLLALVASILALSLSSVYIAKLSVAYEHA